MSERRGDLRGAREERLFIKVLPSDENPESESLIISASTEDVSSSGLSLTISENLPQDTQLELWVEIKAVQANFCLTVRYAGVVPMARSLCVVLSCPMTRNCRIWRIGRIFLCNGSIYRLCNQKFYRLF